MFKRIGLMSLFGLVMIAHSSYAVGIEVVHGRCGSNQIMKKKS
jgi:hypothetical protein